MLRPREEDERESRFRLVPRRDVAPGLGLLPRRRGEEVERPVRPVEDAAPLAAEEERADPARLERRPGPPLDLADEREPLAGARLEVEVVGSGGAAAGTVVEGEGAGQRLGEVEERPDLPPIRCGRCSRWTTVRWRARTGKGLQRRVRSGPKGTPRCSGGRFCAQRKQGRWAIEAASTFAVVDATRCGTCRRRTSTPSATTERVPAPARPASPARRRRPLSLLLAEELRGALGETGLQEPAPSIRCRAAISTVRSQSL